MANAQKQRPITNTCGRCGERLPFTYYTALCIDCRSDVDCAVCGKELSTIALNEGRATCSKCREYMVAPVREAIEALKYKKKIERMKKRIRKQ